MYIYIQVWKIQTWLCSYQFFILPIWKKKDPWNHQAAMLLAAPLFQTTFVGKASAITVLMAKSRESIIPFQSATVSNALTKGLEKSLSHWWAKHWVFLRFIKPSLSNVFFLFLKGQSSPWIPSSLIIAGVFVSLWLCLKRFLLHRS